MKRIKLRAWHIAEKKMCDVRVVTDEGAFLIGVKKGDDQIGDDYIVYAPKDGRFCYNDEFELMLFTGLLDKNGGEIFEGDVTDYCEVDDHDHLLSNITFPILIEYNNAWAQFGWSDGGAWFELDHFRIKEVIGNIYENPELLK